MGRNSGKGSGAPRGRRPAAGASWLYGRHAVLAALANPARRRRRLLATAAAAPLVAAAAPEAAVADAREIAALLPPGAAHQGLALLADPLPEPDLSAVAAAARGRAVAVALDRVADPRNAGAVLRSAAAFGASAVVLPSRHAPEATGALAKAASGALETVPLARPANLVRALGRLKAAGFWAVALDPAAPAALAEADLPDRCVLVLGAEGAGLRRLTREACDLAARVPGTGAVASLNVSAAAAVALHEWFRRGGDARRGGGPIVPRPPVEDRPP